MCIESNKTTNKYCILMILGCVMSVGRMSCSGGLKAVLKELKQLIIGFVKWSFLMRIHVNLVG